MMFVCPKCDGQIDAFRTAPWGDGQALRMNGAQQVGSRPERRTIGVWARSRSRPQRANLFALLCRNYNLNRSTFNSASPLVGTPCLPPRPLRRVRQTLHHPPEEIVKFRRRRRIPRLL